ncbi:MAG: short-chain dehydrogenase, partial [Gemmatimonadetes bacterium]|nr:short-chain dehydrogenase [Gemmatimonadota bacterium]
FPPELAAKLVVRLASGEADALTGRYIHVRDDFDAMLEDTNRIERDDLLALRFTEWKKATDTE